MTQAHTDTRPAFYRFAQDRLGPWVRKYARLNIIGEENLPDPGHGALLACNHSGSFWWDASCLVSGLKDRHIHFIAHHWDAKVKILRAPLDAMQCDFLDERIDDITESSPIVSHLRQGKLMCLYPEESYHSFKQRYTLFRFSGHVIRYAELADVPIIPVAIIGAEEAAPTVFGFKKKGVPLHFPIHPPLILPFKITIEIGQPCTFSELTVDAQGDTYQYGADLLRLKLHNLINQYRDCKLSEQRYIDHSGWQ